MKLIETMSEAIQFIEHGNNSDINEPSDLQPVVFHNIMVIASEYGFDVEEKIDQPFSHGLKYTMKSVARFLCERTPHRIINRERDVESIIRFVDDITSFRMDEIESMGDADHIIIPPYGVGSVAFLKETNVKIRNAFEMYSHYTEVEPVLGKILQIRRDRGSIAHLIVLRPNDMDTSVVRRGVKYLKERGWLPFKCEKSFIVSALDDEVLTKAFNAVYDTKNRTTEHLTMFNCDVLPPLLKRGNFKICPLDSERQIAKFNLLTGQSMNDKKNLVVVNYEFLKNVKE